MFMENTEEATVIKLFNNKFHFTTLVERVRDNSLA